MDSHQDDKNDTLKEPDKASIESYSGNQEDDYDSSLPLWIDNQGEAVEKVFGFNKNAELVNGRAAMVGFLLLLLTELVFGGSPVTHSIFGI